MSGNARFLDPYHPLISSSDAPFWRPDPSLPYYASYSSPLQDLTLYCLRALSLEALRSAFESTRQKSNGEEEEDEEEEDLWRAEIDGVFVPKSFENLSENEIPEGFRMLAGKFAGEKPMSFRVSLAGEFGYAKRTSLEGECGR